MTGEQRFKVTDAHVKLAQRMTVRWWGAEFGAPGIDPKRPYGNSDVIGDILNILGLPEPDEIPETLADYCTQLHRSMQTALQVFLSTGRIEVGEYVSDRYGFNWEPAS